MLDSVGGAGYHECMELDARKQLVLRAVIVDYVRSAEPVGSERLVETHAFTAKAATIRNEMAALANLGYLVQPHTSAGRIPSDKGYRFYVDRLMGEDTVPPPSVSTAHFQEELEEVLRQTCRILSSMTHCPAVATPPQLDNVLLSQIHITPVTPTRVLVVVILSSGEVEHRIIDLGETYPAATLTRLNNVFTEQVTGLGVKAARNAGINLPGDMMGLTKAASRIAKAIADALSREPEEETVLEGTAHILRAPEFQDLERREALLQALEDRRDLLESLRAITDNVDVTIGSENPRASMQDLSFVTMRYHVGTQMTGLIGVFGPTRMAYGHTVPAVRKMGLVLGEVLTRLSME